MDRIRFMKMALKEAMKADTIDEVPIGAIIVKDGKVIARAHNKKETKNQATRHAEIEAIEKATKKVNNWWLEDCDIYVTLEPCAMCAGALINSRLRSIYFGAYDKKAGCCGSLYNLPTDKRFNHRLNVEGGIMEEECASLLTNYFKKKRNKQ